MTSTKPLQRLPEQGQIFGICAGLAAYLELDVVLIRVLFVILAFMTGGLFVVLYIILAFIIPTPPEHSKKNSAAETTEGYDLGEKVQDLSRELQGNRKVNQVRNYIGVALLLFGAWLLLGEFFPSWLAFRWDYVWPILLILVGLLIITRKEK